MLLDYLRGVQAVKGNVMSEESNSQTTNSKGGKIMLEREGEIIVGVLGQWASGKSTAAKTLVEHLGG